MSYDMRRMFNSLNEKEKETLREWLKSEPVEEECICKGLSVVYLQHPHKECPMRACSCKKDPPAELPEEMGMCMVDDEIDNNRPTHKLKHEDKHQKYEYHQQENDRPKDRSFVF